MAGGRTVTMAAVVTLVALGACSSGGHGTASTRSAPTTSTAGASPTSTIAAAPSSTKPTATTIGTGCPANGEGGVPVGLAARAMGDLDGDGKPDTLYVGVGPGGRRRFGVVTASGHRSEWTVPNASPVAPRIYGIADANQDGQLELFVNPGRVAYLLTVTRCTLQPYLNKDGNPYAFSTGFGGPGTGVGCVDADGDGRRDLVGLDETSSVNGTVRWTRTVVTLHGTQARNGATDSGTYHSPADDQAISLLDQVTCGPDAFSNPLVATPG